MNYGKLAFIKATELERELLNNNSNQTSASLGFDCFSVSLNSAFSVESSERKDIAYLTPTNPSKVCVFAKFKVSSETATLVNISLLFNGSTFASSQKTILSGEDEITILSVASMALNDSGLLSILVESQNQCTVSSYNFVIMGATSGEKTEESFFKACELNGKICLAYLRDGEIFYQSKYIEEISFDSQSFVSFKPAKTFDCCFNPDSPEYVYIANTDSQDALYLSTNQNNTSLFIDNSVSAVSLGLVKEEEMFSVVIAYSKNKKVFYRTLTNGVLSDKTELVLPEADYVNINFLKGDFGDCYLIATDSKLNNYFARSVRSMQTNSLMESLVVSSSISFSVRLYALKGDEENSKEHLYASVAMLAYITGQVQNSVSTAEVDHATVNMDFSFETFVIPNDAILYGVDYDITSETAGDGIGNAVYTNDAVGLNYAYISMESNNATPVFHDGGWHDRWPFNQIKPCIIKDGVVTYITDDFTQTIEENPKTLNLNLVYGGQADDYGDFFVEIPKFYYRYNMRDGHILEFRMSSCKRAGFCCFGHTYEGEEYDKVYVASFATSYLGLLPRSIPNKDKWQLSKQTTAFLTQVATDLGAGHSMINLNVLNMLEMLFIIECKSLDYKASIGYGYAYNSSSLSLKKTGTSLSYTDRTYGYLKANQKAVDRFNYIEGFCSFADFALAGTDVREGRLGFYNPEGKQNNTIDDDNFVDYMFFDITFPTAARTTKSYLVSNKVGLLPTEFYDKSNAQPFDLFRSRFNSYSSAYPYRMHFPNLGTANMGLFSYNFPLTNFSCGIQGHRRIYYKPKEESNAG